jgi:hypothetical protein
MNIDDLNPLACGLICSTQLIHQRTQLIGRQMQASLDLGVVQHRVGFAPCDKAVSGQTGQDRARSVLPIQPQQGAFLRNVVRLEVLLDGLDRPTQFLMKMSVAWITETAEPLVTVGLPHGSARADDFPTLAAGVAWSTDVLQAPLWLRQVLPLWQGALAGSFTCAIDIEGQPTPPLRSTNSPVCRSFESGRASRSARKRARRASTGAGVSAAKKRESVERLGSRLRPKRAINGSATGNRAS